MVRKFLKTQGSGCSTAGVSGKLLNACDEVPMLFAFAQYHDTPVFLLVVQWISSGRLSAYIGIIMKAVKSVTKLGLVFGLAAVLTACGGAPSDAEVRKALEEQIQSDMNQVTGGLKGAGLGDAMDSMMPKIDNISPQGCEEAANDIYNCTVEATITVMGMQQTNMQEFSFKKNKAGEWKVMR